MTTAFMPWIDRLAEVSGPIINERDTLEKLTQEAQALERQALALRHSVRARQAELCERIGAQWSADEIERARAAASCIRATLAANIRDERSRSALEAFDGHHTAAEALLAFKRAGVVRQHNLCSTATNAERLQTVERVLAWSNLALCPILDRIGYAEPAAH